MSFEEFLSYIREHVGSYCTDQYWRWKYDTLGFQNRTRDDILHEVPFLAVHAIATDYASKEGRK